MSKCLFAAFLFIFYTPALPAQEKKNFLMPQVDERIETVSIASRLAGINGFTDTGNIVYNIAIHKHFKKFLLHPFVQYLSSLKERLDTANWEVYALALHVKQPPQLTPLIAYDDTAWVDMWEDRTLFNEKAVSLLQSFYNESGCASFFIKQQPYYTYVKQHLKKNIIRVNDKWFPAFLGIGPVESYYPVFALAANYGAYMRVNYRYNSRDTYTIFTDERYTKRGIPVNFPALIHYRSILHEYIHAYSNQLVDENISELQQPAEILLANPRVYTLMKNTFYGNWRYLLYESMVRAVTIKYLFEKDKPGREKEIAQQEKLGFFWIKGLVGQLDLYEHNRIKYKNIRFFMPLIIQYFKNAAINISNI